MKNTISSLYAAAAILSVSLGCSSINPFGDQKAANSSSNTPANRSVTDQAVEAAVGESKIGVAECDDVVKVLTDFANDPNDNFVVKATKSLVANKIKDALKTSIEENQTDKAQLARDCAELKTELEKAMQQEKEKASQQ